MSEVWKPVVGHEGLYEVSSLGRVRSLDRVITRRLGVKGFEDMIVTKTLPGKLLKLQRPPGRRYWVVNICKRRMVKVHHLVGEAFVGPRPPGMMWLHEDDNADNNRSSNIRLGTRKENAEDAVRNGRIPNHERRWNARLTKREAAAILALSGKMPRPRLAERFDVTVSAIQQIHSKRAWRGLEPLVIDEAWEIYRAA